MNDAPDADTLLTGPADVRVYVNDHALSVPHGSTAVDAVRVLSAEQADAVSVGKCRLTDSRGLPIESGRVVSGGFILRVHPVRTPTGRDSGEPFP